MKQVLALVVAVGLVLGAVMLRGALDGDDDTVDAGGTDGSDGGPSPTSGDVDVDDGDGDGPVVVCSTELADACDRLVEDGRIQARVEDPAITADLLSDPEGTPDFDAWLVPQPWPAIVAARTGMSSGTSDVLARSPLVLVAGTDRAAALVAHCGQLDWRCVGDTAGDPWPDAGGQATWGSVKPGHPAPSSTVGLLAVGQAATGYFGSTGFFSNDFADPGFSRWFADLEAAVPNFDPPRSHLYQQVTQRGSYDVVATLEAEAGPFLASAASGDRFAITHLAQPAVADVVLVGATSRADGQELAQSIGIGPLAQALAATGWRTPGQDLADGLDPDLELPATSVLPAPGVLDALRTLWDQVT